MVARLWWKEAKQTWPIWAFLAASGLALQGAAWWYWEDNVNATGFVHIALIFTMMYLFLIAAAVFAGERENGTLRLLDTLAVERSRVWAAKASFALATTSALGVLLWLGAIMLGPSSSETYRRGGVMLVWCLTALGWGLLWSSLLGNALFAAVLAMISLSGSLVAMVNLENGPDTLEGAPALLIVGLVAAAVSALAFQLDGPRPGRVRRRPRPVRAAVVEDPEEVESESGPPRRFWTHAVVRLAWQSLRELRTAIGILVLVGIIVPLSVALNSALDSRTALLWMGNGLTALIAGVCAFNGENRGRTNRFLTQHGARPGVVWGVKVGVWWLAAALICLIAWVPWYLFASPRLVNEPTWEFLRIVYWVASGLTIAFATSTICGMAFRRGITAALIAFIACFLVYVPIGTLVTAGAFQPSHFVYVALAILLVSWAWSGDWLFDRPGARKWIKLALYSTAAIVALGSAHAAQRAWSVPILPPAERERIFQFNRIAAPIPEHQNAAPLYREAAAQFARNPLPEAIQGPYEWYAWFHSLAPGDVKGPELTDWLARIEPALATMRKAARLPACRYDDLRTTTELSTTSEPATYSLITPLAASARVRLSEGDLPGAWTEIETMLRMSRQHAHASWPWQHHAMETAALGLATRWAADPHQTTASLEEGRNAWNALPELPSQADQFRTRALVIWNTLQLPRGELADQLFFRQSGGRKKVDPITKLNYDIQTTPWEIARTRKVFALMAAASIEEIEQNRAHPAAQGAAAHRWPRLDLEEDGKIRTISPEEFDDYFQTTRLVAQFQTRWGALSNDQSNEAERRALGLIFRLRIWQTQHDGALPRTLEELPVSSNDFLEVDPFSGRPFGYIPSEGQRLLPLGALEPRSTADDSAEDLQPTDGCMLLYSIGPDGFDNQAAQDVDRVSRGDIIFPLKDRVKPPADAK